MNDAQAIDGFWSVFDRRDAVVKRDHVRPGHEQFVRHSFQEGIVHALLNGMRLRVEVDDGPVRVFFQWPGEGGVLSRNEEAAATEKRGDFVPVERHLGKHEDGVGRKAFHEVSGRLQQRDGLAR